MIPVSIDDIETFAALVIMFLLGIVAGYSTAQGKMDKLRRELARVTLLVHEDAKKFLEDTRPDK